MNEDLVRDLIVGSPLAKHLGMRVDALAEDHARLALPFAEHNVTIGDTVHGGAIVSLVDTAATAAAWATDAIPENLRGTTVSITVNFLTAARGRELTAEARVVRRGRSICYLDIDVTDTEGSPVAKGLVTYKLG